MTLTRVRIEATGFRPEDVFDELAAAKMLIEHSTEGQWEDAERQGFVPVLQTTKEGFWGRLTMRRPSAERSSDTAV